MYPAHSVTSVLSHVTSMPRLSLTMRFKCALSHSPALFFFIVLAMTSNMPLNSYGLSLDQAPLGYQLDEGGDCCLFCSLLHPQHLEQHLLHSRPQ